MHDLLALLAEDKIAQRDAKLRDQLLQIVGNSKPKQKSVFLMDGTRTQKEIRDEVSVNQGNFSVMVGKLSAAKLLICDTKSPKLAISIPTNFFENHAKTK
jgi:hypothetical protein